MAVLDHDHGGEKQGSPVQFVLLWIGFLVLVWLISLVTGMF